MARLKQLLIVHRFKGHRFDDHGIELDVLSELMTFKAILVEAAEELWRLKHPDRQRLPRGYKQSLSLKFYEVGQGSATIPIYREWDTDEDQIDLLERDHEVNDAVRMLVAAVNSIRFSKPLPDEFPRSIVPTIERYGVTLRDDEEFELILPGDEGGATFDTSSRDKFSRLYEKTYDDQIDVTGEVRAVDIDGRSFLVLLQDGQKVAGRYTPDKEPLITRALYEHNNCKVKFSGLGEFYVTTGKIKAISSIQSLELLQSNAETAIGNESIWAAFRRVQASIDKTAFDKLPVDGSTNHDRYLAGGSGTVL